MLGWDNNFATFAKQLKDALQQPLPGAAAHFSMLPPGREAPDFEAIERQFQPRKAGVLALFYPEDEKAHLVFIKRTSYPGVHSAQISFPGGKAEKHDADILQTALRETEEEIGVAATDIEILGNLSRVYIPPSNFMVQPVVGAIPYKPTFTPHSKEVDVLLPMPFEAFLTANTMQNTRVETRGLVMHVPAFNVQNEIIWGATAMMVAELRALFIK